MMKQRYFLKKDNTKIFTEYETYLRCEDRSENTIRKYMRDLRAFYTFLGRASLTKETVLAWKRQLSESHALSSANSMLAAVNGFLDWIGAPQCKVKPFRIQREIFCKTEKELTQEEYRRLVAAAEDHKNRRLALLLQTICATGIRVSELCFITAEALELGGRPSTARESSASCFCLRSCAGSCAATAGTAGSTPAQSSAPKPDSR